MTQLALASTRRRARLALALVIAATTAPFAITPAGIAAPHAEARASA